MADKVIKQNGVIWFDKSGLSVYLENKPFLRLSFTPDLFLNLEIVDKIKLESLISTFIKQNNLNYSSFILIITPEILFEKDWTIPQTDVQIKEEIDFIESIPFENTLIHSWIKDNKKKLIATNKDFIICLQEAFQKEDVHLTGVFPYSIFDANVRNESVKEIWKNINTFKSDNLLETDIGQNLSEPTISDRTKDNKNSSLMPLLIIIFVVLTGLLIFLLLRK
ncbi:MAG: hypothetical protein WC741_04855 [Patescibacteria group bacterium]|jgi:hypothetical protein